MNIIEQSAELIATNALQPAHFIERVGRIAYQSYDKIDATSAERMVSTLLSRKHESVLEHLVCTITGVTNRGVSHELVRHRIASYTQQSTRYVDAKDMTVIAPSWLSRYVTNSLVYDMWESAMLSAERYYRELRGLGCTKQEARGVLPNDLATEIAITMNAREWRHFLRLRTASDAHPDMIVFAECCQQVLAGYYPKLFAKDSL